LLKTVKMLNDFLDILERNLCFSYRLQKNLAFLHRLLWVSSRHSTSDQATGPSRPEGAGQSENSRALFASLGK
jgi:hypothetical protein